MTHVKTSARLNVSVPVSRNLDQKLHFLERRYPALTVEISSIINLREPDCTPPAPTSPEDDALLSTAQRLSVLMLGYGNGKKKRKKRREAWCE